VSWWFQQSNSKRSLSMLGPRYYSGNEKAPDLGKGRGPSLAVRQNVSGRSVVGRVTLELETSETRETGRNVDGAARRRTDAEHRGKSRIGLMTGRHIRMTTRGHHVTEETAVEAIPAKKPGAGVAGERALAIGPALVVGLGRATIRIGAWTARAHALVTRGARTTRALGSDGALDVVVAAADAGLGEQRAGNIAAVVRLGWLAREATRPARTLALAGAQRTRTLGDDRAGVTSVRPAGAQQCTGKASVPT
jgi:hypothetical protein